MGDAILNSIVSEYLFLNNRKEEGFLSQKRAIIVSRKHLNKVGKKLIPPTKIKSNLKTIPEKIFGNTLEAIIGAIYIDKGIQQVEKFIIKNIYNSTFSKTIFNTDYKSKLLKTAQQLKIKIGYKVLSKNGPDHNQEFLVAVFVNGVKKTEAKGRSIKEAEQRAAKKTYNKLYL